jgi:hypothetical protein
MLKTAAKIRAISYVFKWFKGFREGHEDPEADSMSGKLEKVAKFRELVTRDCQMTKILTQDQLHINQEIISQTACKDFEKRKIYVMFVPYSLMARFLCHDSEELS